MTPENYIGRTCQKYRGNGKEPKPFKSGNKINTIKGVVVNPHTNQPAFTFQEDDSCVDCRGIVVWNNEKSEFIKTFKGNDQP